MKTNKIYHGECLETLKGFEDNCIDTIITDPPYHLTSIVKRFGKKNSAPAKFGTDGVFQRSSKGFMGKEWDGGDIAFQVELWRECLRVLKPGGTVLVFGGTRTYHRMACAIEDSGFVIKDCIMWLYGSGFPKATDISKQLDKKENKEAKQWNGWKSHGLKPSYEPIIVAMKPNEGSYAQNALKHGVAGLNIDGGRIGHNEPEWHTKRNPRKDDITFSKKTCGFNSEKTTLASANQKGRFPANIILDEEAGKMLDEQSGVSKSGKYKGAGSKSGGIWDKSTGKPAGQEYGDKGGASRFFYCAKASKSERNMGCEELENEKFTAGNYSQSSVCKTCNKTLNGTNDHSKCSGEFYYKETESKKTSNNHPTVKPLALMEYLCTLTKTPTGGVVLDPFLGSGTTAIACVNTGREYIGIEKEAEYIKIAEARIKYAEKHKAKELF